MTTTAATEPEKGAAPERAPYGRERQREEERPGDVGPRRRVALRPVTRGCGSCFSTGMRTVKVRSRGCRALTAP